MKKFLEIHNALLSESLLRQCSEGHLIKGLYNGLCCIWFDGKMLYQNEIFKLLMPEDVSGIGGGYWADESSDPEGTEYNSLRQNIILLCAAMNGEL